MHRKFNPLRILRSHLLFVSMASLLALAFALLSLPFLFSLPSSAAPRRGSSPHPTTPMISQACKATRFPKICLESLTSSGSPPLPPNPSPDQIILAALSVPSAYLKTAQSMVRQILDSSAASPNRSIAAKNCAEVLDGSAYRVESTSQILTRVGGGPVRLKDARAWMSAALHQQYACFSGLSYANDTRLVDQTMSFINGMISRTSNALSMIASLDIYGSGVDGWAAPKTERDGFWEIPGTKPGSFKPGGVPPGLKADATVCQRRSGCVVEGKYYKTVQDAVNAAPVNGKGKFVIRILAGVYKETIRIPLQKKNLVFLGEGMGKTILSGSSFVGTGVTTYNTATLAVLGDGFMMRDVTVENTAGPNAHQAVAFRSDSDKSVIENCEFVGNQDTLYAEVLRQYYKSCVILGTLDFIFGNSAAIFQNCVILVRPRQANLDKGASNAVTAQGRVDPGESTGFVLDGCVVNGTSEYMELYRKRPGKFKTFLGRPWKEYSRTVFINCDLEALIRPEGWLQWNNGGFALKTLYYGEFGNKGAGANPSGRVSWSSRIPPEHVNSYSVENFIQGDQWIPSSSS